MSALEETGRSVRWPCLCQYVKQRWDRDRQTEHQTVSIHLHLYGHGRRNNKSEELQNECIIATKRS